LDLTPAHASTTVLMLAYGAGRGGAQRVLVSAAMLTQIRLAKPRS